MNIQQKSKHREAIGTFGSDVFVSLPTGFETSVCFVLLPLICVSPLNISHVGTICHGDIRNKGSVVRL